MNEQEEYRLCQYRRVGTDGRWVPIDRDELIEKLQKEIAELKKT